MAKCYVDVAHKKGRCADMDMQWNAIVVDYRCCLTTSYKRASQRNASENV